MPSDRDYVGQGAGLRAERDRRSYAFRVSPGARVDPMVDQVESVLRGVVDEIVGYLADRVSVQLVGPPGSGRSELLRLVSDRLDDSGYTVLRLFGNRAWRNEPFSALAAAGLTNSPTAPPGTGTARPASERTNALAQAVKGDRVVLVCDDADDMDLRSIGALLSVHRQHRIVAVISSRPHRPMPEDSLALGLTPAVRIDSPTLDADQVHQVCQKILGAPLDAATLAQITMKSGGLHGLVRALAAVGRSSGTLVHRGGLWVAPDDLWSGHLAAAVEPYLAEADQGLLDAATALAVTGPIPVDQAQRFLAPAELDPLLASHLVHHIEDGASGLVGLYPPLLSDYLRKQGSPFGVALAKAHTGWRALEAQEQKVVATQAVGADAAVLNQQMVRHATELVAQHRRVWQLDPTAETALPLLTALHAASAAPDEIKAVIVGTPLGGENDGVALLVTWYSTWLAVDRGDLADALAELDAHAPGLPRHASLLQATKAHLVFLLDRVPPDDLLTDAGVDGSDLASDLSTAVRLEIHIAAGELDRAREILDDFRPRSPVARGIASVCAGLVDVLSGNLDAGIGRAGDELAKAYDARGPILIQAHYFVAILGLTISGRLHEAGRSLSGALSSSTVASFRHVFHTGLLAVGADVASFQGRQEYAQTLAAQALAGGRGAGPFPGMVPELVEAASSHGSQQPGRLWDLVEERIERGYLASAVVIAVSAVNRDPDAERALRVHRLAEGMESPLLRSLGRYVAATAADDLNGLASAVSDLSVLGARLYAVRAAVTRALALRRAGRWAEATEQADAAWRLSSVAGPERSGLFTRLVEDVGLSPREIEILHLRARPLSTLEVASFLQMSVRTVETHLHNAARKLGVSGSEHLLRATATWLQSEPS